MQWYDAKNVSIETVLEPDTEPFGMQIGHNLNIIYHVHVQSGKPGPYLLEGEADDFPLIFKDKMAISVSIDNVYVEGLSAVPYTDCEVYTPLGYHTEVYGCFSQSLFNICAARS